MILLGFGSNLGNREENIIGAMRRLSERYDVQFETVSSLYETSPVGFTDQPLFLNAVAKIQTDMEPFTLLEACLQTEKELGRVRDVKWGPRIIDIDILFYHELQLCTKELSLPHPCLTERRFVLTPLAEIVSGELPVISCTAGNLLSRLENTDTVTSYAKITVEGGRIGIG